MSEVQTTADPKSSDFAGPCARCGGGVPNGLMPGKYPGALSRYDNETYICSDCGVQEALGSGHLIPLDVNLYSDTAKAMLLAYQYHRPGVRNSDEVICQCGWSTGKFELEMDAETAFGDHLTEMVAKHREFPEANVAHSDGRHEGVHPGDIEAFAGLGCTFCATRVTA